MPSDWTIISLVPMLLQPCGPVAIVRLITARVIAAFDCVLWRRLWSHVGVERGKVIEPSVADRNAVRAVIVEHWAAWIQTPLLHRCPRSVLWRSGFSVRSRPVSQDVTSVASTRRGIARREVFPVYDRGLSARALAHPASAAVIGWSARLDRKFSERLSLELQRSHGLIVTEINTATTMVAV